MRDVLLDLGVCVEYYIDFKTFKVIGFGWLCCPRGMLGTVGVFYGHFVAITKENIDLVCEYCSV